MIDVYTDGGADPNPGPGGWGVVILDGDEPREELSGGDPDTTNNRMELTAALRALEHLEPGTPIAIHTDSRYLKNGVTQWLPGWIRRGWQRKGGELKNVDLWKGLARQLDRHRIDWHWVKGHAGNRWNERADELATEALRKVGGGRPEPPAEVDTDVEIWLRISHSRRKGGWAANLRIGDEDETRVDSGTAANAPRYELLAAVELLESLPDGHSVAIYSASDYLRKGASQWLAGWKQAGWTTKAGGDVKNRDLWERIDRQARVRRIEWLAPRDEDATLLAHLDSEATLARKTA
ncbi:MAG: ribonuclease HI [Acidobacteriota bacterium]